MHPVLNEEESRFRAHNIIMSNQHVSGQDLYQELQKSWCIAPVNINTILSSNTFKIYKWNVHFLECIKIKI